MIIDLNEREVFVIINALNYAKEEWATCGDDEMTAMSDDAENLEARLEQQQ